MTDRDDAAYRQGRTDWAAGTVDTSRTADRDYCSGIADERSVDVDRHLQATDQFGNELRFADEDVDEAG